MKTNKELFKMQNAWRKASMLSPHVIKSKTIEDLIHVTQQYLESLQLNKPNTARDKLNNMLADSLPEHYDDICVEFVTEYFDYLQDEINSLKAYIAKQEASTKRAASKQPGSLWPLNVLSKTPNNR